MAERIPFQRPYQALEVPQLVKQWLNMQNQGHANAIMPQPPSGGQQNQVEPWTMPSKAASGDLASEFNFKNVLLTPSCSSALEMMPLTLSLEPGDEVIMPSYTFSTTASAFALRGIVPVFVDVDLQNMCLSLEQCSKALTSKTKAIMAVHYGGWCTNMDLLSDLAKSESLYLLEDAAQALGSKWKSQYLGSIGDMGAISFHSTKNLHSFEGGALVVQGQENFKVAERVREKGTNRSGFLRGESEFYTWTDLGSSYVMSELTAFFLQEQLRHWKLITSERQSLWQQYDLELSSTCQEKGVNTPRVLTDAEHNAHIYYLIFSNREQRDKYINFMKKNGVDVCPHFVPLHSSPMGQRVGRSMGQMKNTNLAGEGLVRLPIYPNLKNAGREVVAATLEFVRAL